MKGQSRRAMPVLLAAVVAAPAVLAGCAALTRQGATARVQDLHRLAPRALAGAQMRVGNEARLELCPVESCPRPTQKSSPARTQASAPVTAAEPVITTAPAIV